MKFFCFGQATPTLFWQKGLKFLSKKTSTLGRRPAFHTTVIFYSENTDCKECYFSIETSVKSSVTQPELLKYGILNITFLPPKQTKCPIWNLFHLTIKVFCSVIFCSQTEMWPVSHQTPWSCTNTGTRSAEKTYIMYKDAQCLLFAFKSRPSPSDQSVLLCLLFLTLPKMYMKERGGLLQQLQARIHRFISDV